MEAYELVEQLERMWPSVPKHVPLVEHGKGVTTFSVFAEVEGLWLYVALRVSPKEGVRDVVVVVDPKVHIKADRVLVVFKGHPSNRGSLLLDVFPHADVSKASNRERVLELCKAAMHAFVKERLAANKLTAQQLRRLSHWSSGSIGGVSAGTPA